RLEHVLDRVALFADRAREIVDADRSAAELVDDGLQELPIHHIQARDVDVEHAQARVGYFASDAALRFHFGVVAHPAQQAVGDARRAARAAGDFARPGAFDFDFEQARRTLDDARELVGRIELEARDDAEAVAQRVRQHAR